MSSNLRTLIPVGVARDGHLIYGPYQKNGMLWQPCDVDVCNGRIINGQYAYVMTTFHPYTIGCWGPGQQHSQFEPSCTNNSGICRLGAKSSGNMIMSKIEMRHFIGLYVLI